MNFISSDMCRNDQLDARHGERVFYTRADGVEILNLMEILDLYHGGAWSSCRVVDSLLRIIMRCQE